MEFAQPLLAVAQEKYAAIDAVLAPVVFAATDRVGWGLKPISTATKDLPFVESPTPLILCLLAYFAIVGSGLVYRKIFPRVVKVIIFGCETLTAFYLWQMAVGGDLSIANAFLNPMRS